MSVKALFLDRDGVINKDYGYVYERERFDFIYGIFDITRYACSHNFKVFIITNQAGIGRGYYSEAQFHELTRWMTERFVEAGAPISQVYFSPYHPTAGIGQYLKDDFSRKPYPGMILQAQKEHEIDLDLSILIGNNFTDIKAGLAAGVGTNLLLASEHPGELSGNEYKLINDLYEAIPYMAS